MISLECLDCRTVFQFDGVINGQNKDIKCPICWERKFMVYAGES